MNMTIYQKIITILLFIICAYLIKIVLDAGMDDVGEKVVGIGLLIFVPFSWIAATRYDKYWGDKARVSFPVSSNSIEVKNVKITRKNSLRVFLAVIAFLIASILINGSR